MFKLIKKLFLLVLSLVLILGIVLGALTIRDFKSEEKLALLIRNNQEKLVPLNKELSMVTYNIGYAGLDKDQDFFADGGEKSRAESKERVEENLKGLYGNIDGLDGDFILLQEVDVEASRSYKVNQLEYFSELLSDYSYTYGVNYRVPWVPVPLLKPMGSVESGIITFAKFKAKGGYRFDLPGKEAWPVQLFELDRCFTETSYPMEGGSELIVVNMHLSAFDKGGLIREQQLEYLKDYMEIEYDKGKYVIIGGDWNHNLPGSDPYGFDHEEEWPFWLQNLPKDFQPEGYKWVSDSKTPTVRTLAKSYREGFNFLAIIDGFMISDNIELVEVKGRHDDFRYSDHNLVEMKFVLK